MNRNWIKILTGSLAMVAVTIAIYFPAARGEFIWDDNVNVAENPHLRAGVDGLRSIWLSLPEKHQYYPLTESTYWLNVQLGGMNPAGFHGVNIFLHAANALMLWWILARFRFPGAWLAAALFAVHPVQVESVAWISERKTVLSHLFYLAAAAAYFRFEERSSPAPGRYYVLALLFFVLGLFSKILAATWPVAMLMIVWWRRGRINSRDLLQLSPFFCLAILMAALSAWMESAPGQLAVAGWTRLTADGLVSGWSPTAGERILLAARALWFYAGKLVWPDPLAMIYPRWPVSTVSIGSWFFVGLTMASLGALWIGRRRFGRGPLTGFGYFAASLAPALGFFNIVYLMEYSYVADHYQYAACVGLLAPAAAGCWRLIHNTRMAVRISGLVLCSAILSALSVKTWKQAHLYRDAGVLWENTIRLNPRDYRAHNDLGVLRWEKGDTAGAMEHFETSLRLNPGYADAYRNLGRVWMQLGDSVQAIELLRKSLALDSQNELAHQALGVLLASEGEPEQAIQQFQAALRINENNADTLSNLGRALVELGRNEEAMACYRRALQIDPQHLQAAANLDELERSGAE